MRIDAILRPEPQHARSTKDHRLIDDGAWFYEDTSGLVVCVQGDYGVTEHLIPLRAIRSYMRRIGEISD